MLKHNETRQIIYRKIKSHFQTLDQFFKFFIMYSIINVPSSE